MSDLALLDLSAFEPATDCVRCGAPLDATLSTLCVSCLEAHAEKHRAYDSTNAAAHRALCIRRFIATVPGDDDGYRRWARTATSELAAAMLVTAPSLSPADRERVLGVDENVRMLLIAGKAGAGKTTFGIARGRMLAERGHEVTFGDALTIAAASRDNRLGHTCDELLSAKAAPVLVLDELGRDLSLGPIASAAIISLIFHRHQHRLRTIVTTGLDSATLRSAYGDDGLWRRLVIDRATVIRVGPDGGAR